MNATVHAYALKQARGDADLADDFVQEAEIAWWRKGEVARKPEGKSRWGCRFVANVARTYWREQREESRRFQLMAPNLIVTDEPVFLVPVETYRQRENRLRRVRRVRAPGYEVLHGDAYRESINARKRELRALRKTAR